jgi:hypothetical protein
MITTLSIKNFCCCMHVKTTCLFIGSEIYQELLVKALAKSFGAKLLVIDYSLLSGVSFLTLLFLLSTDTIVR